MNLREIWKEIVFVPRQGFFVERDTWGRVTNVYWILLSTPRRQMGALWGDGEWRENIDVLGQYLFFGLSAYTDQVSPSEVDRWIDALTRQREADAKERLMEARMPLDEQARENKARAFALVAHADQKYGELPYIAHLHAVRTVLLDFGYSAPFTLAAWLHDVVEDTPVTRDEVAANFGEEVADLVWAVTGVGETRSERVHAAYEKIKENPPAAVLKLADRIANSEASRDYPKKLALYRGEHASFKEHLGTLGDPRMWARLEKALGL